MTSVCWIDIDISPQSDFYFFSRERSFAENGTLFARWRDIINSTHQYVNSSAGVCIYIEWHVCELDNQGLGLQSDGAQYLESKK